MARIHEHPSARLRRMRATTLSGILLLAPVVGLTSVGCAGGPSVSAADAKQWATVQEVSNLYTRLVQFVVQGESSVRALANQRLASRAGRNYLTGAQVSWQNVLAQTTNFTAAQTAVIPSLGQTVGDVKQAATQWLNALDAAQRAVAGGRATRFGDIAGRFLDARKAETALRAQFKVTAAQVAAKVCDLETRNPVLSPNGTASGDCAAAATLSPSP